MAPRGAAVSKTDDTGTTQPTSAAARASLEDLLEMAGEAPLLKAPARRGGHAVAAAALPTAAGPAKALGPPDLASSSQAADAGCNSPPATLRVAAAAENKAAANATAQRGQRLPRAAGVPASTPPPSRRKVQRQSEEEAGRMWQTPSKPQARRKRQASPPSKPLTSKQPRTTRGRAGIASSRGPPPATALVAAKLEPAEDCASFVSICARLELATLKIESALLKSELGFWKGGDAIEQQPSTALVPVSAKRRRIDKQALCELQLQELLLSAVTSSAVVVKHEQPTGRRSQRVRLPVLESWRNERVEYERLPGSLLPTVRSVVLNMAPAQCSSSRRLKARLLPLGDRPHGVKEEMAAVRGPLALTDA
eukprot:TRINITY_DN64045_c0_g1_i1.p1 TRINITY_DN64045_c0_g1~~TRINITY_DN64045_c0_g1_i1.p1  ORF type:complete len:366 (+),score=83.37 TRINITY_DN64045_c0_g1_i1:91-1188(+)